MYNDLLGRLPDSDGETFWVNALKNGARRDTVALGFAVSREREEQHVTNNYLRYLGRAPDQPGLDFWVDQFLHHGRTNEDLITGFPASDEYFQKSTPLP